MLETREGRERKRIRGRRGRGIKGEEERDC